jgi:hypothetical protein
MTHPETAPLPRDPETYRKAREAAGGDPVQELQAAAVHPDMVVMHLGRWRPVQYKTVVGGGFMFSFVTEPGETATRFTSAATLMYRRVVGGGRR